MSKDCRADMRCETAASSKKPEADLSKFVRITQLVFVAICAIIVLIPSVGMIWAPTTSTTENRTLASVPQLETDGTINADYLSDWGEYFEDHFAYRDWLVTANSQLRTLLGSSSTQSVILGRDGWLFYGGTASSFYDGGWITDRELANIAFDLSLIQGYCNANGADFAFMAVPNKNTIYPENMPYYYGEKASADTLQQLSDDLDARGVSNVNVEALLEEAKKQGSDSLLYYKSDTHWNQQGALAACIDLMETLGRHDAAERYAGLEASDEEDHEGDLQRMLYPRMPETEKAPSYDASLDYELIDGANEIDTDASGWIEAEGEGEGVLYMFRDSFAQNMIPFLADEYARCYFDWYVPFDYTKIRGRGVTDVVIEKVERSLVDLAEDPGVIPAPSVKLSEDAFAAAKANAISAPQEEVARISSVGSMVSIEGVVPQELAFDEDDSLFLALETSDEVMFYVPFRVTIDEDDRGYRAYLYDEGLHDVARISVLVVHDGKMSVATTDIE